MRYELDYLELAKAARLEGKKELFWLCFKNHARVMRKKWAKEKAAAGTATRKLSHG